MYYFGVEGDYNVMVIDILGPNLEALFQFCDKKYSQKTLLMMALQCVARMEQLHSKGFIHRDIKPENFCMGVGKKSHIVFSIDFGLAKRFNDPKTGLHIAFKENKGMTGTARYASLSAQLGNEQSRRDDLEAVGYMLCYFLRNGDLPWMGIKAKKKDKIEMLKQLKRDTTFETLLEGHPQEYIEYMKHVRGLAFDQDPNYAYIRKLFEGAMTKNGWTMDYNFDWLIKKMERVRELNPPEVEE